MIYTERKVSIKNDIATIDSPIILFRGDREVEIMFTIVDSKFKFQSNKGNVIDKTQASFGQLAVALPDGTDLFTEIVECENGVVVFSITGEMIDEIHEVGFYSFHIRLYNDDKTSRITLPPVMEGIEIREPLIIEGDVENTDLVGDATVGYSMIQGRGADEEVFDEEGNYIPTVWGIGDKITAEKLNKVETAIEEIRDTTNIIEEIQDTVDMIDENIKVTSTVYGVAVGPQAPWSIFKGWGVPFRKDNLPDTVTGFKTRVTVYNNSDDKNILYNVPVKLFMIEYDTDTKKYKSTHTKLAETILSEPGDIHFSFKLTKENMPEIFAFMVTLELNQEGVLMWDKGDFTNEYLDSDLPISYMINKSGVYYFATIASNAYVKTYFEVFGEETFYPILTGVDQLPSIITKKASLDLPDTLYATVGDTLELFTTGYVNALNPYNYLVSIYFDYGNNTPRKFIFTPKSEHIGEHNMTFTLYDECGVVQDTKSVKLIVSDIPVNPDTQLNMLMIGDSLTSPGIYPAEFLRRLTQTDGTPNGYGLSNIRSIGTRMKDDITYFEGYGGWKHETYLTNYTANIQYKISTSNVKNLVYQKSVWKDGNDNTWVLETINSDNMIFYRAVTGEYLMPESGVLVHVSGGDGSDDSDIVYNSVEPECYNPFWNFDTQCVDMNMYMEKVGVTHIDYIFILLGWNQIFSMGELKEKTVELIETLHEQLPSTHIILIGLQKPDPEGCGYNYEPRGEYANWRNVQIQTSAYNSYLQNLSYQYDYTSFIHIACQYDYEYSRMERESTVSSRCPIKIKEGFNGIHPDRLGYLQIADSMTRHFVYLLHNK